MVNVAFFGTPDFAVPSLDGLLQFCRANKYNLSFVVCQPDKPARRGKHLHMPAIKIYAQENGLTILQPHTLKKASKDGDDFFQTFKAAKIDISIVVAYGHLIPKRLLSIPSYGFINVHASLLPRWRGASPIQKAIESGDKKTGISIMDLSLKMDEGDVYLQNTIDINPGTDSAKLTDELRILGRETLLAALPKILKRTLKKVPQPSDGITYAPKLTKDCGEIDWNKNAKNIFNHCLAMAPWPGSFTFHNNKLIQLFEPQLVDSEANEVATPGTILAVKNNLAVQTKQGIISFASAQLEGKKRLPIKDLINGYSIKINDVLGVKIKQ